MATVPLLTQRWMRSRHASTQLGSTSGAYFEDCNAVLVEGGGHMHDTAMAARLWQVSEALTADYLVTHEGPDWNDFERAARERSGN